MGDLHPIAIDLAAIEASFRGIEPSPGAPDTPDCDWPSSLDDSLLSMSVVEKEEPWGLHHYAHAMPALVCSRCVDGDIEERDARGYKVLLPCRCKPLRLAADTFNRAKIPAQFAHKTQANYEWETPTNGDQVRAELRNALKSGRGVMFTGGAGTGKSHLACSVIRRAMLRRESARFWRWQVLMEAWTGAEFRKYEDYGLTLAGFMKMLLAGRWLVVDDLFMKCTAKIERQGAVMRTILEAALDANIRLVITSNMSGHEIAGAIRDEGTISRLRAAVVEVVVEGEDQRVRRGR